MSCVEDLLKKQKCIRVFGYGSLIWKPDFEFDTRYLGYIEGYERRFWQGSTHHRGTTERPGRVLTLTKREGGRCWGAVYEVTGSEKIKVALDYLQTRERSIGHYDIAIVPVILTEDEEKRGPVYSILYYATPQNELFLGDAPIEEIADDIARSKGMCGYNAEYLIRITDFMRSQLPHEEDDHLYELDTRVRSNIGLGPTNVLPWQTLITLEPFHSKLLHIQPKNKEQYSDERTASLSSVVLA